MNVKIETRENLIKILDWLYETHKTTTDNGIYKGELSKYAPLVINCLSCYGIHIEDDFYNCGSEPFNKNSITEQEFIDKYIDKQNEEFVLPERWDVVVTKENKQYVFERRS
jgi:hypothetical protein